MISRRTVSADVEVVVDGIGLTVKLAQHRKDQVVGFVSHQGSVNPYSAATVAMIVLRRVSTGGTSTSLRYFGHQTT